MRVLRTRAGLASALALVLLLGAGAAASAAGGGLVAFHELSFGSRGFNMPGEQKQDVGRVLRSAPQAAAVLRSWGLDTSSLKSVDFSRQSLVVMLASYQPSGGYRARVMRLVVHGREAVLTASVRREGGEWTTSDLERPWVVVTARRSALAAARGAVRVVRR
jgi:hypothetical protein